MTEIQGGSPANDPLGLAKLGYKTKEEGDAYLKTLNPEELASLKEKAASAKGDINGAADAAALAGNVNGSSAGHDGKDDPLGLGKLGYSKEQVDTWLSQGYTVDEIKSGLAASGSKTSQVNKA